MYASLDMDCNSILQTLLDINKVINMHTWVVIHVMSNNEMGLLSFISCEFYPWDCLWSFGWCKKSKWELIWHLLKPLVCRWFIKQRNLPWGRIKRVTLKWLPSKISQVAKSISNLYKVEMIYYQQIIVWLIIDRTLKWIHKYNL